MMLSLIDADWPAPANVVAGTTTRVATDDVLPPGIRYLNQVHGASIASAAATRDADEPVDADAVIGREQGDCCAVRTADCLPVLFCAKDGGAVGAAHAGWRGLAAGVLENTVAAMGVPGANLMVWLGPAISQTNFEVGDEVRDAFLKTDPAASGMFVPNARQRWQADLHGLARRRLSTLGIAAVYGGHWCTFADAEHFYSYRRAADSGRMVSFVLLK